MDVSTLISYTMIGGLMLLLAAAVAAGCLGRAPGAGRLAAYAGSALGCAVLGGVALASLFGGYTARFVLWQPVPFASFELHLDALAAFFLLVVAAGGFAVSIYAPSYTAHYPHYKPQLLGPAYAVFLFGMAAVVLASNAFTFLVAWELMALVSYLLVVTDHNDREVQRAGFIYIVMTHSGTAFIVVAFMLIYALTGTFDFALWAQGPHLAGAVRDAAFVCAFVGFGTKAGVVPLHIWLPRAHPVAPSHVSALMSGVMLKTAIYGLVRVCFEFLGGAPMPAWWGGLVLGAGAISAVIGVLYALMESDLKRLLAYSSVENIGIIFIGLGAAMLLWSTGNPALAAVALLASLYHTLNHALFKGLLFMGAGAVHYATGTKNMEALGGLVRRMPQTAALFLIGSIAISGLPPFNGFVSEWLTFQGLLGVGSATSAVPGIGALLAAGALALTAALAAACFVKAFGITFLAMPRTQAASSHVHEVPVGMRFAMGLLASACLVFGILPGLGTGLASPALAQLGMHLPMPAPGVAEGAGNVAGMTLGGTLGQVAPAILLVFGLLLALLPWILTRGLGRRAALATRTRTVPTWACGSPLLPVNEYTGAGFVKPLRIVFRSVLRPQRELDVEHGPHPFFPIRLQYRAVVPPLIEQRLYGPALRSLLAATRWVRLIQNGSIQSYLAYIFAALIVVLLLAR